MNAIGSSRDPLARKIAATAAIFGGLGVLIGAFGAHGLEARLADAGLDPALIVKRLGQFDVGARYHLVHAVTMLVVSNLPSISHRARRIVFVWLTLGIVLFSGSLYLLVLTNTPWLGAITPLGGVAWILAWFTIAGSALANRQASNE